MRGPRTQADRKLYAAAMQAAIRAQDGLAVIEAEADDLILDGNRVTGVLLKDGRSISTPAVVLTTGTSCAASSISAKSRSRPAVSAKRRRSDSRRRSNAPASHSDV